MKIKCGRLLNLTIRFTVKAHRCFGGEWVFKIGNLSLLCCDRNMGLLAKHNAATLWR